MIDPRIGYPVPNASGQTATTNINGAGESVTAIGHIILEGGPTSGSKTISSAGGKIHWVVSALPEFSDLASNLRVGIQDVGATGIEDGTFDVYADLAGGVATFPDGGVVTTPMTTGSKIINHNDLVAVSFEMTAYGGSDDISIGIAPNFRNLPYRTQDTGAGPTKQGTNGIPLFIIEFNDGTLGWFVAGYSALYSQQTLGTGSTPDEVALVFKMPISCEVNYVHIPLASIGATDAFDVVIYKDPMGTPLVIQTISIDPNKVGSSVTGGILSIPIAPLKVSANLFYGISVKPTTAGFVNLTKYDFGSGNSYLRRATILQENWGYGHRVDGSGPFTYDEEKLPAIGFEISKINSGAFVYPLGC